MSQRRIAKMALVRPCPRPQTHPPMLLCLHLAACSYADNFITHVRACIKLHHINDAMPGLQIGTSIPAAVLEGNAPSASDALQLDAPGMSSLSIPLLQNDESELV
jgi:hypothetical protein